MTVTQGPSINPKVKVTGEGLGRPSSNAFMFI